MMMFMWLIVCDMGIRIRNIEKVMEFCSCLTSSRERVSTSLENFFQRESSAFLLVFWVLFLFLIVVSFSVMGARECWLA